MLEKLGQFAHIDGVIELGQLREDQNTQSDYFKPETPPSCQNLVKQRGGFLASNLRAGDPIWADSPLEILILGVQKGQNFPPAAGFPLVNIDFRAPKPQNFRLRRHFPL